MSCEIKEQFISNRLNEVIREINVLKRQLAEIWETKQQTDTEVLALAERLDLLLNEHDRLLQESANGSIIRGRGSNLVEMAT